MKDTKKRDLLKRNILSYKNPRDIGAFAILIIIVLLVIYVYNNAELVESFMDVGKKYSNGWTDEKGENVILSNLTHNKNCKKNKTYVIKKKISKKDVNLSNGDSLCFISKNITVRGYIEGKKAFGTKIKKTYLDTLSPGVSWIYYNFTKEDIGKNIELHITMDFKDNSSSISNMRIANQRDYVLSYIYDKAFILVIYAIMMGMALVLVVGGLSLKDRKISGLCELLMSLGATTAVLIMWLVIDTRILSLFFDVTSMFQAISIGCLYMVPIPAAYVLKNLFELENRKFFNIISSVFLAVNIIVWTLHLTNTIDFLESLWVCHTYLIVATLCVIIDIIYEYRKRPKIYGRKSLGVAVKVVAVMVLLMGIIADVLRYNQNGLKGGLSFVQVDVILLVVYGAAISLGRVIQLNHEMKQSEFVSKLAYKDGLTGVRNRTAYMEKLENIRTNSFDYEKIGIVAFDVNDLKMVNDVYGHAEGDALIINTAELLDKSFRENCEVYRIGGDEFIVLINAPHADKIYKLGIMQFKNSVQNFNNFYRKNYKISVANGVAFCDSKDIEEHLNEKLKEADANMYRDKEEMKREC